MSSNFVTSELSKFALGTDTLAIASVLECHAELAELRRREKLAQEALSKDEHNEAASKELSGSAEIKFSYAKINSSNQRSPTQQLICT
jgi:hypothetical protein